MGTKAVIFDMDGLMFDTERLSDALWMELSAQKKLGITQEDMALLRGRTRAAGKESFLKRFGPAFPFDAVCDEMLRRLEAHLAKEVPMRPGLQPLLDALKERGILAAVASSTHRSLVESNLRVAGVERYFSAVCTGDEVTHSKPAPDIFLLAAQRLRVQPSECIVLEDSYNGVRAGQASGCRTIMVPDMDPPTAEMQQLADEIVPSLMDVIPLL